MFYPICRHFSTKKKRKKYAIQRDGLEQMIGNSINHQDDNRLEELNHRGLSLQDDDTASIKSYGSHKNRPFKDESHKGSAETMDGEEKRDVSKEDLGIDEGE